MNRRRSLRLVGIVVVAFGGALVPLLLLDGARRAQGFRGYGLLLGVLALRAVLGFSLEAGEPPIGSPFSRPTRLAPLRQRARRRKRRGPKATAVDHLVDSATSQASGFHFRLRPVLRDVADQRLRSHHGIGIDDAAAAPLLGAVAHDLLRHDRPAPDDRRSAGIAPAVLADVLTTLERL